MPSGSAMDDGKTIEVNELHTGLQKDVDPDSECNLNSFSLGRDDSLVTWESPDDPLNPQNWAPRRKLIHIAVVSVFTFATNLASIIFAPGAPLLVKEFDITNSMVATLTVSIYVLGTCAGPLFIAPVSEIYGRLMVYWVSSVVYEACTIGCALSSNVSAFLAFRFVAGCAGAAPMAVAGGSIADMYPPEGRGTAMAIFSVGPMFGPVIGPVIGGFLAEYWGWRWTFWLVAIMAGLSLISIFCLGETYEPILLARKAATLRKTTGSYQLRPARTASVSVSHLQHLGRSSLRPIKMLIFSPIILFISLYCAFVFGLTYLLYTTFPSVFEEKYNWGPSLSGLSYLGLTIGMFIAIGWIGAVSDKKIKQDKANGIDVQPEVRLKPMLWTVLITPLGFLWYGWAAKANNLHWILPVLGTVLIGLGSFAILMPSQVYLVDAFGSETAASSMAANTFLRSLFGAFIPLAGPPLYQGLDLGWGNTLLAFISLLFAPIPWLLWKYGKKLRVQFPVNY